MLTHLIFSIGNLRVFLDLCRAAQDSERAASASANAAYALRNQHKNLVAAVRWRDVGSQVCVRVSRTGRCRLGAGRSRHDLQHLAAARSSGPRNVGAIAGQHLVCRPRTQQCACAAGIAVNYFSACHGVKQVEFTGAARNAVKDIEFRRRCGHGCTANHQLVFDDID